MNLTQQQTNNGNDVRAKFIEAHKGFKNPNVLLMGQSGSGKTRSISTLDPKRSLVIVTEKSTLTFPKAKSFYEANAIREIKNFKQIMACIYNESINPNIDVIVIDSFTGLWRSALKIAEAESQGFTKWDKFANYIQEFLDLIMDVRQVVIVIGHSEKMGANDMDSEYETEVVIDGKKLKKLPISSQFEITLMSKKDYETDDQVRYVFYTNALKHTPAKSPEGMLERIVPNDLGLVVERIKKYYE